jgi:hypothetical protein
MEIPFNPNATVAPSGPVGVFQNVGRNPNAFGAGLAQGEQQAGQAIERAGSELSQIALTLQAEKNRADGASAEIGWTKAFDDINYHPDNGYLNTKGKAAPDALPDAIAAAEKVRTDTLAAAPNDAVRRMISPLLARATQSSITTMYRHARTESDKWQLGVAEALPQTMINSAALNYNDEKKWGETIGGIKHQAGVIAGLRGEGEDGRQVTEQKLIDHAWTMRLDAWRLDDPVGALAKFQTSRDQMSATAQLTLGTKLFAAAEPVLGAQLNAQGGPAIPAAPTVPPAKADETLPRGIRNNNPGNIQKSEIPWEGKLADGNDPRYESFDTPEAGIRAVSMNLRAYQEKYGIDTINGIVARWAPSTENNTQAYIAAVSKDLGVKPDAKLNLADPKLLIGLTKAIIKQENGKQPYTDEQFAAATGNAPLQKSKGYSDVTPEQAMTMQTGNAVVDSLPADQKMHVIALARTQANQGLTQQREALRYRVTDAIAMYENGVVPPSAPSNDEILATFGQDHGARIVHQVAQAQQFGQDVQEVTKLPASEQMALLAKRAPVPGDGYEFDVKRQAQLAQAIDRVQKQREQDPAAFVLQNSPQVMDAYRAMANAKTPEERPAATQAYAASALAEQGRLEVTDPKILPKNYVDQVSKKFYAPEADAGSVMRGMVNDWGRFWPTVGKQLAKHIPPGAVVLGLGVQPEAEQLITEALRLKPEQLKQGFKDPAELKDLQERVRAQFEPLQKTLAYQGGGQETYDNYADTADSLAIMLMHRGMKPKEAASKAFDSMVGFKYEFEGEWRVPKSALGGTTTVPAIRSGATMARYDIAEKGDLAVPATPGAVRGEDAAKQWRNTVQDNGFWVTSPGDGGLSLWVKSGLGAQPVLDARGQNVRRTWAELSAAGSGITAAFPADVYGPGKRSLR